MTEPKQIFPVVLSSRANVDKRQAPPSPDNAKGVRTLHIPGKIHDDVQDLRPRSTKFDMKVEVEPTSGPKAQRPAASSAIDSAFSFGNVESESGTHSTPEATTNLPIHPSALLEVPADAEKEDLLPTMTIADLEPDIF